MSIPKIIHQLWIGPKPPPTKFMDTWKNIHEPLGFQYIRWTEAELQKRGFKTQLGHKINDMNEINGKADIIRWELLYEYGGIFVDADSICIEPFTHLIEKYKAFAGYENEHVRAAGWANQKYSDVLAPTHPLIATGTMAFPPKHELPRLAIEWIKNNDISIERTGKRAWRTVGPGLLTRLYFSRKWQDITILPSYYFLPIHASGLEYKQHGRVFAYQEWGSTKNNYENMNKISLPKQFLKPNNNVSILMPCYNANASFLKETLESIKNQLGYLNINLVCMNDGSDSLHTTILKKMLQQFQNTTRWIKVCYHENEKNLGIGPTLHNGVLLCPDEIIFRMDSDDIMFPERIIKQLEFMDKTPECVLCGAQIQFLSGNTLRDKTNHSTLTLNEYKKNPKHWIMNHPTFCFRKSKIIEAGNYNNNTREMIEDFELILKVLKTFGKIHNLPDTLLYYRLHPGQITHNGGKGGSAYWNGIRNNIIKNLIG